MDEVRPRADKGERGRGEGLASSVEAHLQAYFAAHEEGLPAAGLYARIVQEVELPLLSIALEACGGNQIRAAELLGINRNTLRKKLRELGLREVPETKRRRSVLGRASR